MFYLKQFLLLLIISITLFFPSGNILQLFLFLFFTYLYIRLLGLLLGDPPVLLFIALVSFNIRPFLDEYFETASFGITNGFFKSGVFEDPILETSTLYIKLSIFVFLIGLLGRKYEPKTISFCKVREGYSIYKNVLLLPTVVFCILLIFICFFNGGYSYFNSGSLDVSTLRVFIPMLTVCLALNVIFYQNKIITTILIMTGLGISIFVGARLIGMSPLICYFIYLSVSNRRSFSKKLPIIGFFVISFSVFVNFFRAKNSILGVIELNDVFLFFLQEISFTSNLVPMAMEYTSKYDYAYGINYLGAIVSIIPKAAFWMRLEEGTYSFSSALGLYYDPVAVKNGLGLNGSLMGESYFSFGFCGVIVSFLLSKLSKVMYVDVGKNNFWSFFVISSSPYIMTSFIFESSIVFRNVFYYSLFPIAVYFLLKRKAIDNKGAKC
ncbi:O-antigen polysaccharide polymerase Wzy [Aeromonas veronii]|uniref:O-antigen polysaccharide polymerase Wzy n=1 Tax=Aeromonas veronii TaxID=654 RepID=UPI003D1F8E09